MPKFMDYHAKMPEMPPEAMQQIAERVKAGQADEFGVKPINLYMGSSGQACCVTEAPSADAVRQSHSAAGAPSPDEVVEVQSLA